MLTGFVLLVDGDLVRAVVSLVVAIVFSGLRLYIQPLEIDGSEMVNILVSLVLEVTYAGALVTKACEQSPQGCQEIGFDSDATKGESHREVCLA